MDKYASMWKADTPVERQADARELWDDLTGITHAKQDTTARLQELFPAARTHNKEAQESTYLSPAEMLAEKNRVLGRNDGKGVAGFIGKNDVIKDRFYSGLEGSIYGGLLGYGGALAAKRLGAPIDASRMELIGTGLAGLGGYKGVVDVDDERLREAGIRQSMASKYLGVGSGRMTKKASKSSVIRDRLLGAGLAGGAIVGGGYQYNQSKKNSKGLTKRQQDRLIRDAAYQKSLEMGGSAKSKAGVKVDRMREKYENYLDANPGMATAMGATLGGGAALLGGTQAIKRLASRVK